MSLLVAMILAAQPAANPPLVVRHPDGSVTLQRRIEAQPPEPAPATHGLAEEASDRTARREKRQREAELDSDLREAFEEAVDQARSSLPD